MRTYQMVCRLWSRRLSSMISQGRGHAALDPDMPTWKRNMPGCRCEACTLSRPGNTRSADSRLITAMRFLIELIRDHMISRMLNGAVVQCSFWILLLWNALTHRLIVKPWYVFLKASRLVRKFCNPLKSVASGKALPAQGISHCLSS